MKEISIKLRAEDISSEAMRPLIEAILALKPEVGSLEIGIK